MSRTLASVAALLLLLLPLLACQTRSKSMAALCDLPNACPECREAFDAGDSSLFQNYLRHNAPHPDIGRMLQDAAQAHDPSERLRIVRQWAASEGIEDCAFADWLARPIAARP